MPVYGHRICGIKLKTTNLVTFKSKCFCENTCNLNKILFQSKVDHSRMCVFGYACASRFFAPVTLTLTRWPWYMNLTYTRNSRCICEAKKDELSVDQHFQKSDRRTQCATKTDWCDRTHYQAAIMSNSNLTDRLCKQLSEMIAAYPPLSEMLRFLAVLKLLQYGTCSEPV